jgi:hypothetical protein
MLIRLRRTALSKTPHAWADGPMFVFLIPLLPNNRPVDNPAFGKCKKIRKKTKVSAKAADNTIKRE